VRVADAVQYVKQISFRIKIVEFGRTNQAVDHRSSFAAGIRACEQIVLPTQGRAAHSPLGGIVLYLDAAMVAQTC